MNLDYELYGNSLVAMLTSLGIAAGIMLAVAVIRWVAINRLGKLAERTDTSLDDSFVSVLTGTKLLLFAPLALHLATQSLKLPDPAPSVLRAASTLALILQAGLWGNRLLSFWIQRSTARAMAQDAGSATGLVALKFVGRGLLWSILLLMALDNLGVNVTSLIAGLGVGGVAVALALQNVLGDLFASLSIVLDKPFVLGDFVVVGDFAGTIEKVGLKTTRIRSLSGEQLVFANGDLLQSRIRNYKRMKERRILFRFGLLYQTTPEQLEKVPGVVKEIIGATPNTRFDRAHFAAFGDSSYDFEVVYIMEVPDYGPYMDAQQQINLAMVRAFAKMGVDFAYPTRTLYMAGPVELSRGKSNGATSPNPEVRPSPMA